MKKYFRYLYWRLPKSVTEIIQGWRFDQYSKSGIYRKGMDETESIYIHIPKVAGKSISYAIYGEDPRHHKLIEFQQLDRKKYDQYFKFSFVRNPWSRLFSIYNYLQAQTTRNPYGRFYWITKYRSFNQFVQQGLTEDLVEEEKFFATQYSYLADQHGKLGVDYVGRFESLETDFVVAIKHLGINACLEHIGRGDPGRNYLNEYTGNSVERVARVYSKDVEAFQYDF